MAPDARRRCQSLSPTAPDRHNQPAPIAVHRARSRGAAPRKVLRAVRARRRARLRARRGPRGAAAGARLEVVPPPRLLACGRAARAAERAAARSWQARLLARRLRTAVEPAGRRRLRAEARRGLGRGARRRSPRGGLSEAAGAAAAAPEGERLLGCRAGRGGAGSARLGAGGVGCAAPRSSSSARRCGSSSSSSSVPARRCRRLVSLGSRARRGAVARLPRTVVAPRAPRSGSTRPRPRPRPRPRRLAAAA
jgi:hypothetical protein